MGIRQEQVAELLRRHMSIVIQQEGQYIFGAAPLVTVMNVIMTPDLGLAKFYFSIYNTDNKQAVMLELESAKPQLKQSLYRRIKNHIRRMPEIDFYDDNTIDEMEQVESLFKRLRADRQMGQEEE